MASPKSSPKKRVTSAAAVAETRPKKRRRRVPVLSAEETVERLRVLYVTLARRGFRSVSSLSRASKVPYETLRSFLKSEKHQLEPANEEKLARALGFDGAFFRWLVRRYAQAVDWQGRCLWRLAARAALWVVFEMPGE